MLLHADGFRGGDVTTKWDSTSTGTRGTTSPRFPGGAYLSGGTAWKTFASLASAEVFVSAAFWFVSSAGAVFSFWSDGGTTQHITITRTAGGLIEIRRGSSSGTVLATGSTVVPASAWMQIEARCTVADSGGVVQVRLGGTTTTEVSFTGDTRNGGTSTLIDRTTVTAVNSSAKVTDAVICNTAGAMNNTWNGPVSVQTLAPTGDGTYSDGDLAPTASVAHYTYVDDLPTSSSDGVWVYSADSETFTFANTTGVDQAIGMMVNLATFGQTSGSMKRLIRSGGTDYLGSTITIPAVAATTWPEVLEINPATSAAWTAADIDALDLGVRGLSSSGALLIAAYVEILYDCSKNIVSLGGGGTITVDAGNVVSVSGGGTIDTAAAGMSSLVDVNGGGTISTGTRTDGYPRSEPSDPTIAEPDHAVEPVIEEVRVTYPAPTLVDGVPVDWEPS